MHLLHRAGQGRQQTAPAHGLNALPLVAAAGPRNLRQFQQRGRDVSNVRETAQYLVWLHSRHAGNEHRRADATFTRIELVATQRGGGCAGPAWPHDGVSALVAKLVDGLRVLCPQPGLGVAVVRTLGAVVGQKDKHRVLEVTALLQVRDQAPDVVVHGLGHGGVNLHPAFLVLLVAGAQCIPAFGAVHGRHRRVFGNQPKFRRLVTACLPQGRPALLIAALVLVNESARRLQRDVIRLKTDIGEEGFARAGTGAQVADGLVNKEFRRVVGGRHDGLLAVFIPVHSVGMRQVALLRIPVVRASVALHQRALKTTLIGPVVRLGAHVPFAGDIGTVTAVLEQRGHRDHTLVERTQIARLAQMRLRHGLRQVAHAVAVVVDARQQHRAGWRAGGSHVKIGKTHALVRQGIEIRRGDLAAKSADIAKAPVVRHQHHDIGARPVRCQNSHATAQGQCANQRALLHATVSADASVLAFNNSSCTAHKRS